MSHFSQRTPVVKRRINVCLHLLDCFSSLRNAQGKHLPQFTSLPSHRCIRWRFQFSASTAVTLQVIFWYLVSYGIWQRVHLTHTPKSGTAGCKLPSIDGTLTEHLPWTFYTLVSEIADIFSYSIIHLLLLFMVSFREQKYLFLLESNPFFFSWYTIYVLKVLWAPPHYPPPFTNSQVTKVFSIFCC